jgi:hypothetical protein
VVGYSADYRVVSRTVRQLLELFNPVHPIRTPSNCAHNLSAAHPSAQARGGAMYSVNFKIL